MTGKNAVAVSVIVPVYNAEKYLEKSLDSIISQKLENIEIICVDDGSTDGSSHILDRYAEKDARISVIRQKNQYAGVARNNGLKRSKGKYVVFWDCDDWFMPDALQKLYDKCEKTGAQIGICDADKYDESADIQYPGVEFLVRRRVPDKEVFSKADMEQYLFNFASNVPWNKLFLRSFIQEHQLGFQTLSQANDIYFVMMALYLAERITVVPEQLIVYRTQNPSSVTGKSQNTAYCTAQALEAVWETLVHDPGFSDELRRSFSNKTIGPLMHAWRRQMNPVTSKEMYRRYKEEIFPKFDLTNQPASFFHNIYDSDAIHHMETLDYEEYILYERSIYVYRYGLMRGEKGKSIRDLRNSREYQTGRRIVRAGRKLKSFIHR